jgi:NTP pyrophosphatase (non-canonical NTP hydrolase)
MMNDKLLQANFGNTALRVSEIRIFEVVKHENNHPNMTETKEITRALVDFRNERDWEQFHNPKDLALALSIEASELLELFLWKNAEEADLEKLKEELADIFAYAFLLADKYSLDVKRIVMDKIRKNGEKYPVHKAKGSAKKYNEL